MEPIIGERFSPSNHPKTLMIVTAMGSQVMDL
jgi:hypothetical protein